MSWYIPMSEEEVQAARISLIPEGHYEKVKLFEAKLHTSSEGKKNVQISVLVTLPDYSFKKVFGVLSGHEKMQFLTRHLAEGLDLLSEYERGILTPELLLLKKSIYIKGGATIGIQKARPKSEGSSEMWPERNNILDFGDPKRRKKTEETPLSELKEKLSPSNEIVRSSEPFDDVFPY